MTTETVVALDIGTHKTCALVGEAREDGIIMITGMGLCPSISIRKGIIQDMERVSDCVRQAIEMAEKSSDVSIRKVFITVSGGHIQSMINSGTVPVYDRNEGVTIDEIEEVKNIARSINLPHDRETLHTITQKYSVDDQQDIINPEGMQGGKLSLNMLIIHGSRNLLNNTARVATSIGLNVANVMFDGLCSALATLTSEQKKCGVALIDLGAGTSSYVVFEDNILATAGVLAVGGDHITNDIAHGFNISLKRAEKLKCESGNATPDPSAHFQQIIIPSEVGFSECAIPISDLNTVIAARVDEIFTLIKNDLKRKSALDRIPAGVILTGGCVHLQGIEAAASRVFDMPCVTGKPKSFSGMASVYEGPEYASALGMVRHAALETMRTRDSGILGGWVKRWFGTRD